MDYIAGQRLPVAAYRIGAPMPCGAFGGIGFHISGHTFDRKYAPEAAWSEVFEKRLRELRPTYVRMWHHWDWTQADLDHVATYLKVLEEIGASVYFATQTAKACESETELADYAESLARHFEYLVRDKGLGNIRHYCMSNELRLYYHGDMLYDMRVFERYHRAIRTAFDAHGLSIGLLATDVSGESRWLANLGEAGERMDDVTDAYCAHAYVPFWTKLNHPSMPYYPFDNEFRVWLQNGVQAHQGLDELLAAAVALSEKRGKRFVLGEFGVQGPEGTRGNCWLERGVFRDESYCYNTELAPYVCVQLSQIAALAINRGVYAACAWALEDYPDAYHPRRTNHWGVYRWDGGFQARESYYGFGLVTRFMRAGTHPLAIAPDPVGNPSPGLFIAAVMQPQRARVSILVVNRNQIPRMPILLTGLPAGTRLQKYAYDAEHPTHSDFADMPGPACEVEITREGLRDVLAPYTITVYTNDVPDELPSPPQRVEAVPCEQGLRIQWEAMPGACYYRVERDGAQVTSTAATCYAGAQAGEYRIVTVDDGYRSSAPSAPASLHERAE